MECAPEVPSLEGRKTPHSGHFPQEQLSLAPTTPPSIPQQASRPLQRNPRNTYTLPTPAPPTRAPRFETPSGRPATDTPSRSRSIAAPGTRPMEEETLEQVQARHRKEQRDLVARTTGKKKNATKKTRKGVNDECAELERAMRERQAGELARAAGEVEAEEEEDDDDGDEQHQNERQQSLEDKAPPASDVDDLAGRMGGASIVDEQQQQGGGKKRNRQKERLTRRAAEQEEAAVRAEAEAGSMTDHRGLERKYMAGVFEAQGLVEKDIQPDGHCLFSAVADQLGQRGIALGGKGKGEGDGEPPYRVVRRAAADWMAGRPDDYAPFLEEPLDGYLGKIRDTAEWGGQLELAALAARYGVEIKVVQDGRTETIETPGGADGKGAAEVIWLAYYRHGYGLGEHYNSLRKTS